MRAKRDPVFAVSAADRQRWPIAAIALLAGAVLLGGGQIQGPIRNGLIEAGAGLLLVGLAWREAAKPSLPATARAPLALTVALLLLILFQLTPLPWPSGMSGREISDAVLALGRTGGPQWRSLTLDASATARFAASLMVPVALALATLRAGQAGRLLLLRALAILAAVSALLATVQLALGYPGWASPFGLPDPGFADGLFVNRNHQAMFLLSGMLATGLWIRLEGTGSGSPLRIGLGPWRVHAAWLLLPLFAMMIFAAGSKAGILLLLPILTATIAIALGERRANSRFAIPPTIVPVAIAALVIALIAVALPSDLMGGIRARFVFGGDTRIDFLPDVLLLIRQYFPWGSGFGTFVPAYAGIEDLDRMGFAYLNHAHNEYLEWLVEGGLPAGLMLIAAIGVFGGRLWLVLASSRSGPRKAMATTGAAILLVLGLHSGIDYPLRADALAAVAGIAIGLLFTPALDPQPAPVERSASRRHRRLALLLPASLALLMSAQIIRLRLAEVASGDANGALAAIIQSHDGMANAYVAEATLARGDARLARRQALEAINQSPLSVVAVRTLAMADGTLGDLAGTRSAWRAAAAMGWRDLPTQYWAMRQALADHEVAIAGQRADAVLRLNNGGGPFATLTRTALGDPALRQGLVPRVALRPAWRGGLFNSPTPLTDAEIAGLLPTLLDMQRGAAPPTRGEVRQLVYTLLIKHRWSEALAVDRPFAMARKNDSGSLLDDGGFDRAVASYNVDASPFDWMIGVVGNSNVAAIDEAPPRAMVITTDGKSEASGLTRWVALSPGQYELVFKMSGAPDSPTSLGVTVFCDQKRIGRSLTDNLAGDGFQARRFRFDVPADCPVIIIGVGGFASGIDAEAEFDDFRLAPVTPASASAPPATRG